jgi:periplasmic divalent cation tolerance protein
MTGGELEIVFAYITTKNRDEAVRIGRLLVERRLAACVNILDGMESIYSWEGKIESARETVLIAKSTRSAAGDLIRVVADQHSYQCPCVAILPVTGGNTPYLQWIENGVVS